ncbi:MAG: 4-hydroxybenzoate octaprenyltransferase [Alphaproteobacteria bacterium]|nr:4-hydroxybenzoate octaprenyltransferase [Alphaproteobacteria bacterium]
MNHFSLKPIPRIKRGQSPVPADSPASLQPGHWLHRVPPVLIPYILLARLDRPVGFWLLAFPCWWGLALGGNLVVENYLLFLLGAIVMRGAGCTLNDIIDRELDKAVARTRTRPLPAGMVTVPQAVLFLLVQLGVGLLVALYLGQLVVILSAAILVVVLAYPYMKRITWWPQLFLGIAFNWGAIVGFVVAQGRVSVAAILLYLSGILWTVGYDTIYAHQDREDDQMVGIRSTARRWGADSKWQIGLCYGLAAVLLGMAALAAHHAAAALVAVALVGVHFAWQVKGLAADDPRDCLMRFRSNRWVGWIVTLGLLMQ